MEESMEEKTLRESPIVSFHIRTPEKEALEKLAKAKGMSLATFCRSTVLSVLKKEEKK